MPELVADVNAVAGHLLEEAGQEKVGGWLPAWLAGCGPQAERGLLGALSLCLRQLQRSIRLLPTSPSPRPAPSPHHPFPSPSLLPPAPPQLVLVGHDWGANTCWGAAATAPHLFSRLAIHCVPHPECFLRNMDGDQFARSW